MRYPPFSPPPRRWLTTAASSAFPAEVLGKVYGVVNRRRGKIVSEEMKEGTSFFTIRALLPVIESFGFADGTCAVLLSPVVGRLTHPFSCRLPRDPQAFFWSCEPTACLQRVRDARLGSLLGSDNRCGSSFLLLSPALLLTQGPSLTVEELEDLGTLAERANVAKVYVDDVRTRKGLFVERKIVENAQKQRTLKR